MKTSIHEAPFPESASPQMLKSSGSGLMDASVTAKNPSTVPTEDARHFAEAMSSPEQQSEKKAPSSPVKSDAQKGRKHDPKEQEKEPSEQSDELSFASLFAGRFDASSVSRSTPVSKTEKEEPMAPAESLAERLAERILVSEPSAAGQEVRIQPSRDILPDTEISLIRGADGILSAIIHTDNPVSFQTLAGAQHDLRSRLEQSEHQSVHVELRSSADDADPRRRSRGLDLYPEA